MKILSLLRIAALALVGTAVFINSDQTNSSSFQCAAPTHPDYLPLMALYNSTNGDNWTNNTGWGVDCDVCLWEGIGCANNRVRSIELQNNNMVGFIPDDFSQLDSLVSIRFRNNQISGTFPATLSELAKLEEISMYNNDLNGSFPAVLFDIPTLNQLDLGFNSFEGPIPNLFDQLPELKFLTLRQNGFVGSFPPTIYLLSELERLDMFDIEIGSILSSDLGNLTSLTHLNLRNTLMSGNLPESIGNLQSLIDLDISYVQLGGDIPNTFYSLSSLENAQMRELGLTGNISTQIENLKSLKRLDLSHNYLAGIIPSEVAGLDAITELNLGYNELLGEIPEGLYALGTLQRLDLRNNYLTGEVSNQLSQLTNLTNLTLIQNELEGEFPDVIGDLTKLKVLYISNNKFTGDFPISIGESTSLTNVTLSSNYFTGCFPLDYSSLCNVNLASFNLNCTFENPTFTEFCAGAECNNTLNLDAPSLLVCEGETFTIKSPSGYTGYEWSVPGQNASTLVAEASASQYYYITITNSRGCTKADSIFIEVIPKVFGEEIRDICDGGSVVVNGETYSQVGTFTQTIPQNGACDSTVIVTINQGAGTSGSYSESICSGTTATINGATFGVGQFTQVIANTAGCDSTISIEITALPTYNETLDYIVCEGSTYSYNGQELTVGAHVFDYQSMSGCDSTVTVNVIASSGTSGSYSESICSGTTTTINGATFGVGQFTQVIANTAGCDSTISIEITALPTYDETLDYIVCEGLTYSYNGQELTVGAHVFDYQSMNGCDSTVTVNVIGSSGTSGSYSESICSGTTATINGATFGVGQFTQVIANTAGCDSTISIEITALPTYDETLDYIVCEGSTYSYNGQELTVGAHVFDYQSMSGCDSTVTVNVIASSGTSGSYSESICSGTTTTINGVTFGVGQFTQVIANTAGCDSTISIEITALPTYDETLDYIVCEGSTYSYNGQELTVGAHVFDYQSMNGCDSTVTVNVGLKASSSSTVFDEICEGGSVSIAGTKFDKGGEFVVILTNQAGCDSIISVTILEKPIASTNLIEIICSGQQFPIGTDSYNSSGFYQSILQNNLGCDSIVNLDLTVISGEDQVIEYSICQGDSYAFAGKNYSESITVSDSIIIDGCTSWVTLELTVFDNTIYEYSKSICAGEVEYFFDQVLDESGTYIHTLSSAQNCDSTIIINLNVLALNENTLDTFLCAGASLFYGEETFSEAGNFVVESETDEGCEEVTYLNIDFYETEKVFVQEFVCDGELVEFEGQSYGAGQYTGTFDDGSCEVEFELTVAELARLPRDEVQTLCMGDVLNFMGETYLSGGQYFIGEELDGCEFLENLIVVEASNETTSIPQIFCQGKSFQLEGESIFTSGIYPVNSDSPCSDQFYDVLFVSGEELSLTKKILAGSEVVIDNEVFDAEGSYEIVIGEEVGCPTILILTIIVEQCGGVRNEKKSICDGESVQFFDQVINTPGSYQYLKKLESGCDSVINLEVELSTIEDFQIEGASFICEGQEAVLSGPAGYYYLWSTGAISSSISIQKGGVYDLTISNMNGCSLAKSMIVEEVKFPNTAIDIIAKDPSSCSAENGSIVIETNDGQNYQYSIDGGLTFQHDSSFVGLANGSYGIVISDDQLRCFKALSTSVKLESAGIPEIDEIKIQGVNDCVGSLGAITVVPAEMNQPYEYSIDGGLTWSPDSVFTSLEVGFYDVQMKLPNSECINNLSALIKIEAEDALEAEISVVSALTCTSSVDGILELEVVKGKPPYKILWSNGDTTIETMNLSAGIYTVTIEDSNQCSQFLELELSGFEIESLLLEFEDVIKCEDETVRFEVDSNYTYEIYKEGQLYYEASQVELEEAGQYEVIVDLGEACKSSNSFAIENLDVDGLGIDFLLSTEGVKDVEVYGINVSQLSGGSFEWEVSGNAVQVDSIDHYTQGFTFRDTGVYKVSLISTVNNCQVILEKSIIIYPDSTYLLEPGDLDPPSSLEGFGSWNVYPSPNDGTFEVEIEMLSKKLPATIVIYDVYGSKILQRDLEGSLKYLESFTLNNVGTGIYNISLIIRDRVFYKNILIIK